LLNNPEALTKYVLCDDPPHSTFNIKVYSSLTDLRRSTINTVVPMVSIKTTTQIAVRAADGIPFLAADDSILAEMVELKIVHYYLASINVVD